MVKPNIFIMMGKSGVGKTFLEKAYINYSNSGTIISSIDCYKQALNNLVNREQVGEETYRNLLSAMKQANGQDINTMLVLHDILSACKYEQKAGFPIFVDIRETEYAYHLDGVLRNMNIPCKIIFVRGDGNTYSNASDSEDYEYLVYDDLFYNRKTDDDVDAFLCMIDNMLGDVKE